MNNKPWKENNTLLKLKESYSPKAEDIKELFKGTKHPLLKDEATEIIKKWYSNAADYGFDVKFEDKDDFINNEITRELFDNCDNLHEKYVVRLVMGYKNDPDEEDEEAYEKEAKKNH